MARQIAAILLLGPSIRTAHRHSEDRQDKELRVCECTLAANIAVRAGRERRVSGECILFGWSERVGSFIGWPVDGRMKIEKLLLLLPCDGPNSVLTLQVESDLVLPLA